MTEQKRLTDWRREDVANSEDAVRFVRACVNELGLGFHPDTPFDDYVRLGGDTMNDARHGDYVLAPGQGGDRVYSDDEAGLLDAVMDEAIRRYHGDVYALGLATFEAELPPQHKGHPVDPDDHPAAPINYGDVDVDTIRVEIIGGLGSWCVRWTEGAAARHQGFDHKPNAEAFGVELRNRSVEAQAVVKGSVDLDSMDRLAWNYAIIQSLPSNPIGDVACPSCGAEVTLWADDGEADHADRAECAGTPARDACGWNVDNEPMPI